MRGRNFLLTVRRLAAERDELRIVADQHGAPTWCRTIADATAQAVARLRGTQSDGIDRAAWEETSGIYHLTAQGCTSWHGFAQEIVAHDASGRRPVVTPIASSDYPVPAKRPANSSLSCEKFLQTFCHLPQWDAALRLCLE